MPPFDTHAETLHHPERDNYGEIRFVESPDSVSGIERLTGGFPLLVCGDDRLMIDGYVHEGDHRLRSEVEQERVETLRIFGAVPTFAEHVLTTVIIQAAERGLTPQQALAEAGIRSFEELLEDTSIRLLVRAGVLPTVHSATANEGGHAFDATRQQGIGCARNESHAAVSALSIANQRVRGESLHLAHHVFGVSDQEHARITEGVRIAKHTSLPQRLAGLAIGRQLFRESRLPIVMYTGDHTKPDQADLYLSFSLDHHTPPNGNTYAVDVARAAEAAVLAWPELNLDPETFMRVMVHDSIATKAALRGDSPTGLDVVVIGSASQAATRILAARSSINA